MNKLPERNVDNHAVGHLTSWPGLFVIFLFQIRIAVSIGSFPLLHTAEIERERQILLHEEHCRIKLCLDLLDDARNQGLVKFHDEFAIKQIPALPLLENI